MVKPKAGWFAATALAVVTLLLCAWLTTHHFFLGAGAFAAALTVLWITLRKITAERSVACVILFLIGVVEWGVIYPVKVSLAFDYDGKHFETSYLTTVIMHLNDPKISFVRWDVGRRQRSLLLPDGSLVILAPNWPVGWQTFPSGTRYEARGRWFWLDSAGTPQLVVYGDAATRRSAKRIGAAPFPWIEVTATSERVSELFLPQALHSDSRPDAAAERLAYSSLYGGSQSPSGALFQQVALTPLIDQRPPAEGIQRLLDESGWLSVSADCRMKPVAPRDPRPANLGVFSERVGLIREAGTWRADSGPRPGEPAVMYSTGRYVTEIPFHERPAIEMVHSVEWEGQTCTGLKLPPDAVTELIQFANGRLALLSISSEMAILKQ